MNSKQQLKASNYIDYFKAIVMLSEECDLSGLLIKLYENDETLRDHLRTERWEFGAIVDIQAGELSTNKSNFIINCNDFDEEVFQSNAYRQELRKVTFVVVPNSMRIRIDASKYHEAQDALLNMTSESFGSVVVDEFS